MADNTAEVVEGYIEHIIYRNEENGYTVFELTTDTEELTAVGFFQFVGEGESIRAEGRFTEHYAYGRQFKIDRMEIRVPEDAEAIERYLASGAVKGIGRILAARIVKAFGDDTLRIIREEPERLSEIKGISPRKAQEIAVRVSEQEEMRSAMLFMQTYGLSMTMCVRIYKAYGQKLYDILRENPYKLAEDIEGIGFRIADEIASRGGIRPDSEFRIRAGLIYVLYQASGEGHLYLPEDELIRETVTLLAVDEERIRKCLDDLMIEHRIVVRILPRKAVYGQDDDRLPSAEEAADSMDGVRVVYASSFYYLELNCARHLCELNCVCATNEAKIEKILEENRETAGIELDDEQSAAVSLAARQGLVILTGGPGTGKTTAINEMIRYFEAADLSFVLAAPTGRAARRMTEATGYEASTIHRLLEIGPSDISGTDDRASFGRNEMNPLEADVVIIDEMSMVDISLMHALLSAIPKGTRLILVGDADQLPSVGPGDVLRDIIRSEAFPTVRLTRIFRQEEGSDIIVNAHAINAGRQIRLDTKSRDFFFLKRSDPDTIINQMVGFITGKLPAYVGARPLDLQVLTPMKKGALGAVMLNRVLQERLNPPDGKKREHTFGDRLFRVGDKVMQVKNNYQIEWEIRGKYGIPTDRGLGIFNGDMGIIREINDFASVMTIEFDGGRVVTYPFGIQEELELAYAITIHKSQGSEYPAVLLPLLGGPRPLMTRNLLYTAVTRAKSCLVILGDEETVRMMIDNLKTRVRYTSLDRRIIEMEET